MSLDNSNKIVLPLINPIPNPNPTPTPTPTPTPIPKPIPPVPKPIKNNKQIIINQLYHIINEVNANYPKYYVLNDLNAVLNNLILNSPNF